MFLSEPSSTPYDARFSLLGIPVRVHPLFWILPLFLGIQTAVVVPEAQLKIMAILIWVMVVFFSIVVHEFGHVFAMMYYGQRARVVLYVMGGLAIPDNNSGGWGQDRPWGNSWQSSPYGSSSGGQSRSPGQQIVISAAGPAAGFLFAMLIALFCVLCGGQIEYSPLFGVVPYFDIVGLGDNFADDRLRIMVLVLVDALIFVNVGWGILNLLPIFPLDGGQISRQLFIINDPYRGVEYSLWLSVMAAGGIALLGLRYQQPFLLFLMISLAFQSYQLLNQMRGGRW